MTRHRLACIPGEAIIAGIMRLPPACLCCCVLSLAFVAGCTTAPHDGHPPADAGLTRSHGAAVLNEPVQQRTKGPDVRGNGEHRLHVAARTDDLELLIQLLGREPEKLEIANLSRQTPLHIAARWDSQDVARYLVEIGADIHARDVYGNTPLHQAAIAGANEIPRILIQAGAALDIRRRDGRTPLDIAISYNKKPLAQFLIDRGATPNMHRLDPPDI